MGCLLATSRLPGCSVEATFSKTKTNVMTLLSLGSFSTYFFSLSLCVCVQHPQLGHHHTSGPAAYCWILFYVSSWFPEYSKVAYWLSPDTECSWVHPVLDKNATVDLFQLSSWSVYTQWSRKKWKGTRAKHRDDAFVFQPKVCVCILSFCRWVCKQAWDRWKDEFE